MSLVITSKQNHLVKYLRGLRDKRTREAEQLFLVEGPKFVSEAVFTGVFPAQIIVSERGVKLPAFREIIDRAGSRSQVIRVSDPVMEYVCETETPQGILALVQMPARSLADLTITASSLLVVLDGVQDPGNVGTVIRTADAFGAAAVLLTRGCADLYNAKTLRSTMGSLWHLPVLRDLEIPELTAFLQANRVFTAVTCLAETARPLPGADLKWPLAVVFGSEARGVSAGLNRLAGIELKIPMTGRAQSLNVATAAGIVLYEAFCYLHANAKSNAKSNL